MPISPHSYLCIGGPLDGQRMVTEREDYFRAAEFEPLAMRQMHESPSAPVKTKSTLYVVFELASVEGGFRMWRPQHQTALETIEKLLRGYHPLSPEQPHNKGE